MLNKIIFIMGFVLLLTANIYAMQSKEVLQKHLEKAVWQSTQPLRPHLSQQKLDKIPQLLTAAKVQAQKKLGLADMTEEGVVESLYFYLGGGYNPIEEQAVTEERLVLAERFSKEDLEHALHYALMVIVPEQYDSFLEPKLYPAVKNWDDFYMLCQAFMDTFYNILSKKLAVGDPEMLENVFLNDLD